MIKDTHIIVVRFESNEDVILFSNANKDALLDSYFNACRMSGLKFHEFYKSMFSRSEPHFTDDYPTVGYTVELSEDIIAKLKSIDCPIDELNVSMWGDKMDKYLTKEGLANLLAWFICFGDETGTIRVEVLSEYNTVSFCHSNQISRILKIGHAFKEPEAVPAYAGGGSYAIAADPVFV